MPNSFEKQMTDAFCLDFAFRVTEFKVFSKNKWDISIHLKSKSIIVAPKREDKIANVQIYHAASGTLPESYFLPSLHHIYDPCAACRCHKYYKAITIVTWSFLNFISILDHYKLHFVREFLKRFQIQYFFKEMEFQNSIHNWVSAPGTGR